MRIVRLAQLLEYKYDLAATAGPKELEQKLNDVRQEILDAYNHYINIDSKNLKPAYNIVPLLAESGEKFSKQVIALMEDLVNDIDTIDLHDLFAKVQNVLAVIDELQTGKKTDVRNSIHDMFTMRRDTDKNRREIAKSKFENVVFKKLAAILQKAAKSLNVLLGKSSSIMGGPTEPQVKEPTKEEQNMFRRTQLAVIHHLDDGPIFGKIWVEHPDLKRRMIRLINKGKNRWAQLHLDPEVMAETSAIVNEYKRRQTNEGYFEAGEDAAKEMARPKWFTPTPEQKRERELQQQNTPAPLTEAEYLKMHQEKALQQRLEDAKKYQQETNPLNLQKQQDEAQRLKEIEEDRERLIRSEGKMDVLLARFAKRYL